MTWSLLQMSIDMSMFKREMSIDMSMLIWYWEKRKA